MKLSPRIILVGIIGFAVLIAGGWSALWFTGKEEAEKQVTAALETLSRAGAKATYDAVEISGFPFSYEASVEKLAIDTRRNRIALPKVSATVSVDAADRVTFTLPPSFEVVDKQSGALFVVASEAMTAEVSPVEENAYALALQAASLSIASETKGAPGPIEIKALDAKGAFSAPPAGGEASLTLALQAKEAVQKFSLDEGEEQSLSGAVRAAAPSLKLDGSLTLLASSFKAEKLLAEFDKGAVFEIVAPEYAVSAKPKERFDPAPLGGAEDLRGAVTAFAAMAAKGVAEGGVADAKLNFASLKGTGELEGQLNVADVQDFTLSLDFGSQRVGAKLGAKKLLVDGRLPDGSAYYHSAEDQFTSLEATPSDVFDFSILAQAGASALGLQAVGAEIYTKIVQGGAFELVNRSGPSVIRNTDAAGLMPFKQLESRGEGGTARIAINPKETIIAIASRPVSYAASGGLEGEVSAEGLKFDFLGPMKASEEAQKAQLRTSIGAVAADESLWALIDPEKGLKREIKGLDLKAEADVYISQNVLSPETDLFALSGVTPAGLTLSKSYLDAFGLRAEIEGNLTVVPLPNGAFKLGLTGWRQFFSGVQKTPLVEDKDFVDALFAVNDLIVKYGAPTDPAAPEADALIFDILLTGPTGFKVNGKPFEG